MVRLFKKHNSHVEALINANYLTQLPIMCFVIFLYYSFITAAHFVFLPPELVAPIASTSFLAAAAGLLLYFLVKLDKVTEAQAQISIVPVLLLVFLTVFVHIHLSGDSIQLTNAIMLIYALGFLTVSPLIYTLLMALAAVFYFLCLKTHMGPYATHLAFMFAAVFALSIMGFLSRYRSLLKLIILLIRSQRQSRQLSITGGQLRDKIVEVEAASKARDIFLANVTHELRTPLTGVIGMLDLLRENKLNKDQRFMADTARRSADYLLNIVNDLLDLSKMEAGKLELRERPVELIEVTQDVVETFRGQAASKGIKLLFAKPETEKILVYADDVRLSQVLLNLVNNAVKFTDKGEVKVGLEVDSNSKAVWTVQDTGSGISSGMAGKLFKRFEQFDQTVTRTKGGTGLGLSIVYELVTLMGGKVDLESKEGEGSSFIVSLALKPQSALDQEGAGLAPQNVQNTISFKDLKLHALVAEDNHVNQMLVARILKRMDMKVTVVENGQLALEAVQNPDNKFDIIFMDMQMPVMDGITATKKILKLEGDIPPIVALTANTHEKDVVEYKAAGMAGLIGKPINLVECQKTIFEVLQKD